MPLPPGMKVVPKKGETKAEAEERLLKKYGDPPRRRNGSQRGGASRTVPEEERSSRVGRFTGERSDLRPSSTYGSPSGNRNLSSTATSGAYTLASSKSFGSEKTTLISESPVVTHDLYGGFTAMSIPKRDPFRSTSHVWLYEYNLIQWQSFKQGGTADPVGADLVSAAVLQFFQKMSARISMEKRLIPLQVLTTITDWETWLNNYSTAYLTLRGLQGMLAAGAFNYGTETVTAAIMGGGNYERLQFDLERLATLAHPPGLREILDPLCGSYVLGPATPCMMSVFNQTRGAATNSDITTTAGIAGILAAGEASLTAVEATGAETAIVNMLMGFLYGVPAPLPDKPVYTDPGYWALHFTQALRFRDVTTSLTWSNPCGVSVIPVLVPKGSKCAQLFTFLRPDAFTFAAAPGAATPTIEGLISMNATNEASVVGSISPLGVFASLVASATTANSLTVAAPTGITGQFGWYLPLDADEDTIGNDFRAMDYWDVYWINISQMSAVTLARLDEIFLGGMKIGRPSEVNVQG